MKTIKILLGGVFLVLAGILIVLTFRHNPPPPEDFFKHLNLSKAEIQQLHDMRKTTWLKQKDTFKDLGTLHQQLNDELCKETLDEAKIQAIIENISLKQNAINKIHLSGLIDLRKTLGAEKFKKVTSSFDQKRKEGFDRFKKHQKKGDHEKDEMDGMPPPPPPAI